LDGYLTNRWFTGLTQIGPRYFKKKFLLTKILVFAFLFGGIAFSNESQNEQLLFVLPDNWVEIYSDRTENLSTSEYAPEGQTEDNWQEMISVQILLDTKNRDPDLMLTKVASHFKKECRKFSVKPIQLTGIQDIYPSLTMMTYCEQKEGEDFGEIGIVRGISGKESFYLLQKLWRTDPFKADEELPVNLEQRKFWLGYIAYLGICNPTLKNCPVNLSP